MQIKMIYYFIRLTKKNVCAILYKIISPKGGQDMNFHLTDQRKKKINSVQSKPMKHCAEYSV